ncbi:MAG: LptF/LptG family permease, partial [Spirochaetia bacterium]
MTRIPGFRRIDLYILNEFLISFVVAFLFFFCTFFINQLLVLAEEIFSKKVPFWDVLQFIVFSLPSILALSLPFGALVGSLMAMGRFASDNEILAFRASGVARHRILNPLLAAGVLLFLVSFVMN